MAVSSLTVLPLPGEGCGSQGRQLLSYTSTITFPLNGFLSFFLISVDSNVCVCVYGVKIFFLPLDAEHEVWWTIQATLLCDLG